MYELMTDASPLTCFTSIYTFHLLKKKRSLGGGSQFNGYKQNSKFKFTK